MTNRRGGDTILHMKSQSHLTAEQALARLKQGNGRYLEEKRMGDYSRALRNRLFAEGQAPYAAVVACSDSRVVPEAVFDAGLGELFVIRVAGNVIGTHQLASIGYAVSHLSCPLVVVLGHTGCGAVAAALEGGAHGLSAALTDDILRAIAPADLPETASRKNAVFAAATVESAMKKEGIAVRVVSAIYHTDDGSVEFL